MKVVSTRGKMKPISFEEALFTTYCPDGGMTMPASIPQVSMDTLRKWKTLTYPELVKRIIEMYISSEEIDVKTQSDIIDKAFTSFDIDEVVKISKLNNSLEILELGHGETMAFKDLAMTCTAQMLSHFLKKRNKVMTSVIITSGDTGSSAMYSLRNIPEISTIVMYPHNMVSEIQKLMMTTIDDKSCHVFAIPIEMEEMDTFFNRLTEDQDFMQKHSIGTLNSQNWCRIMIQAAHHIFGYLHKCRKIGNPVNIIIPNGACGNLSACILAQQMGVPINPISVTNANDSLHRVISNNDWRKTDAVETLAPAMNMTFLTNFERVLWMLSGFDSELMTSLMKSYYNRDNDVKMPKGLHEKVFSSIKTSVASDEKIRDSMKRCWQENKYLLDPHTACAVAYYYDVVDKIEGKDVSYLCVSTADAAKFPEILEKIQLPVPRSEKIEKFCKKKEKFSLLPPDQWQNIIKDKIEEITRGRDT